MKNKITNSQITTYRVSLTKSMNPTNIILPDSCLIFVIGDNALVSSEGKINRTVSSDFFYLHQASDSLRAISKGQSYLLIVTLADIFSFINSKVSHAESYTIPPDALPMEGRLGELVHLLNGYLDDNLTDPDLYLTTKECLLRLIFSYYTIDQLSAFFSPITNRDILFKDFILKNCLNTNSLDELSHLANYSKSGFVKRFQRCFGVSPYKWIVEYKAKRILHEVCTTRRQFIEIAEDHGFNSHSYFYAFCKKHYGYSPSELRKKGRVALKKGLFLDLGCFYNI